MGESGLRKKMAGTMILWQGVSVGLDVGGCGKWTAHQAREDRNMCEDHAGT